MISIERSEPAASESPYVGPRPFQQAESDRFFGRDRESRDVRSLWVAERVLVLHGPPAVGKTSLLHAGVVPLLAYEDDIDILPAGRLAHQVARPTAVLRPHNGYSFTLLNSWALSEQPPAPGTSIADFLQVRRTQSASQDEPNSILAAVDQFEELFTSFPALHEERVGFVDELAEALRTITALRLLLLIRDDHVPELARYEERLSPYRFTYVRLDPLDPEAAQEAVERPLESTSRTFAPGVAKELVDSLRTTTYTDVLGETVNLEEQWVQPLVLQIVCAALWSALPEETQVIRGEDLQAAGDIGQAIIHFYDTVVREVSAETGESEERLRAWIEATFVTDHGTRGTAYRGIDTTADIPNKVLDSFVMRHFLTEERRALSTWYQLAQDRLISAVQRSNATWRTRHREQAREPAHSTADANTFRAAAEEAFGVGNYASAHRFAQVAASQYRSTGDERRLAHTLVLEGDIARSEGDFLTAQENLRAALSTFDILQDRYSTVRTLSALADLSASTGDFAAAEELQRQAVSRLPTDVQALIGLGYAQWYGGAPADAEATFTQALSWNIRASRALAGRGQVRVEMRDYQAGLRDLDNALEVGVPLTDEIDCRSARAVALAGTAQIAAAERELTMARSQDPRRARTHLRAALVAGMLGRKTEERKELEEALRGFPKLSSFDEEKVRRRLASLDQR